MIMDFLLSSDIWLLISFLVFASIVWCKGRAAFFALLDKHIDGIKNDLSTAESLRVEAQELLAQYQRKHRDAVKEAEQIVADAEARAAEIAKEADKELSALVARREEQLKERLERLEQNAIAEIQAHAANLAVQAAAEIIASTLDKKASEKLVDNSIKGLAQNIH